MIKGGKAKKKSEHGKVGGKSNNFGKEGLRVLRPPFPLKRGRGGRKIKLRGARGRKASSWGSDRNQYERDQKEGEEGRRKEQFRNELRRGRTPFLREEIMTKQTGIITPGDWGEARGIQNPPTKNKKKKKKK